MRLARVGGSCGGEVVVVYIVGRVASQQVCAGGDLDRAASRIGSVGIAATRGEDGGNVNCT
jgi:hypothetical protein